ncbi:hypothetical protein BD779DRAFT_1575099 [Infundibulicybe gibba]|nr:hypothetical protein BD779DRAFT_1575099 [Infundibulicybe gibba]
MSSLSVCTLRNYEPSCSHIGAKNELSALVRYYSTRAAEWLGMQSLSSSFFVETTFKASHGQLCVEIRP